MNTEEMVDILDRMVSVEGTEVGDSWRCLCYLYNYKDNLINDSFKEELDKEIEAQYEYFLTIENEITDD